MRIATLTVRVFTYPSTTVHDSEGHSHPGPEHPARLAILTVAADDGAEGYAFGSPDTLRPRVVEGYLKPVLLGQDPFHRERLWQELARWQRGSGGALTDRALAVVDLALWDLAGRRLGMPVWKLLGGGRVRVPAYGSTMCGDELPGGLSTPDDYARFAEQLVRRGYRAIKLHTWMPPVAGAPSVALDLKACAAVREAVGPEVALMLDPYHWYSRMEAYELGRGLQRLGFAWFEEPMDEHSLSAYRWLADNLEIPILGPETVEGKLHARAEWIAAGACDILRTGVHDVGGLTPSLKVAHLAEAFNMECEIHGGGAGNLALLGAIPNGRWYERGLLHPFLDYEAVPPYLTGRIDPMDASGHIPMPSGPGLGEAINFEYIDQHQVPPGGPAGE
jgi:L-alanine-DL-glutamate epimerase-like enolase superfamily enzyme